MSHIFVLLYEKSCQFIPPAARNKGFFLNSFCSSIAAAVLSVVAVVVWKKKVWFSKQISDRGGWIIVRADFFSFTGNALVLNIHHYLSRELYAQGVE